MTRDEAEAAVPRVKAALAEVGFGAAVVKAVEHTKFGGWGVGIDERVPMHVDWTARLIVGEGVLSCWPCFRAKHTNEMPMGDASGCDHDPWTSERPKIGSMR